jgi:serine protease
MCSPRIAIAALGAVVTLSLSPAANAQLPIIDQQQPPCTFPPSAYSTGAPFGVRSPGSQPVNDPVFPDQWGLGQIKAPTAWQRGDRGAGITIAVVDTGVDLGHPDLARHLVPGADLTSARVQGCSGAQDENGHGTHVAGIAAAVTNNGIGVAGTAPSAKVMPVRVLDAEGSGDDPTVINGVKYAADHGAQIINLSLGGDPLSGTTEALNQEIADAVVYAYSRGALIVAAAGNESFPLCSYPAAARYAACVAATDRRGLPAAYSNFPDSTEPSNVGVRAPGGIGDPLGCEDSEDIWSTLWPGGDACRNTRAGDLSGYDTFAGTSMASPFVAGLAAILAGKGLSNGQILACLKGTSSNHGQFDPVMGYGIVDADAATRTCSVRATRARPGPNWLRVTVRHTTARRLARTRKLRIRLRAGRAMTVRLRAVLRARPRARARVIGARRFRLHRAGYRRGDVRISRRGARLLRRHPRARLAVRYRGGGVRGRAAAN